MSRIPGVPSDQVGEALRDMYEVSQRSLGKLTGRMPEGGIAPLELYAHVPDLMAAYWSLERATAQLCNLDRRLRGLAELKAATLTHCEFCIDIGSQIVRKWGISDDQLLALPQYRESQLFTTLEKLVLDYAVCMSRTPVDVSDALFGELRRHLDDSQLVELTHVIAMENLRGRFNLALGIGAAGYSEGMVCAIPAREADRLSDSNAGR